MGTTRWGTLSVEAGREGIEGLEGGMQRAHPPAPWQWCETVAAEAAAQGLSGSGILPLGLAASMP